jgi:hypothetical protein
MLYTMVELIHTLSYIRTRKLHCCLCLLWILLNMLIKLKINLQQTLLKIMGLSLKEVLFLLQLLLLLSYVIILMHHVILCFVNLLCLVQCLLSLIFCRSSLMMGWSRDDSNSRRKGWWGHRQDGVEDDSNSRRGGWWGHRYAGHTDAMVFLKLQFVPNSAVTSPSDLVDTSPLFRS